MSSIGVLTIEMAANIARLQSDMDQAKRVVNESMQSIQQAVDLAKKAFVAFAGVATVDAFAGMVRGSIDAAAAMGKLATQAGTTVEALSGLAAVGKLSGTSADAVAGAMNKMTKAMSGAGEDAKGAGAALSALGISFDDFNKMSPDERMLTVAKAMDGFADGAGKSGVAMALMGKSGAEMLPYMKDLAQVGELQAKVTAEQAAQAKDFNNNLLKVTATQDAWKKQISMAMLPALDEASKAFLALMNGTGGVREEVAKLSKDGSITEWTRNAITGFTYLVDAGEMVWRTLKSIGIGIGSLAAGAVQMAQGNFKDAAKSFSAGWEDVGNVFSDQTLGSKFRARMEEVKGITVAVSDQKPALDANFNAINKNKDAVDQQAKAYESLMSTLRSKIAADLLESTTGKALTEGQKARLEIDKQLADGKIKLKDATSEQTRAVLEELDKAAAAKDLALLRVAADKAAAEAHIKYLQSLDAGNQTLQTEIEKQQLANAEIGLGKEAVAALVSARNEQKAVLIELQAIKALDKNSDEVTYNSLMREAQAIRDLNKLREEGAAKQVAVDEAKKANDAWTKFYDSIYNGLSDSLYRAFEKGKGFFQSFWDGITNLFKTTILKVAIQGVVGSVVGALGLPGAAQAQGATGVGSLLSSGGTLGSLGGAVSSGFNLAMNGLASDAIAAGATMVQTATGVTSALAGIGQMVGAAAPYLAAALAAYKVIGSLTGGETRTGTQLGYHAGAGIDMQVSPSGGAPAGATEALTATVNNINGLLTSLGSHLSVAYFTGGLESSQNGKGFNYAGGVLSNNVAFGTGTNGQGYLENRGSASIAEATAAYTLDLKKATIDALKVATDIPKSVQDFLKTVDTKTLNDATADAIIKDIGAVAAFQQALTKLPFEQLKNLTFDATNALLGAAGGADKLGASLGVYYDKFYTTTEKTAQATAQISQGFADIGVTMPAVDGSTRAWYRSQVELAGQQDLSVEANAKLYYGLVSMAGAVDAIAPAATAAAAKINDLANLQKTHGDLEVQLLQAQGKSEEALKLQREQSIVGLDKESEAQAKKNFALEDQIKAEAAAAEKAKAIADERKGLQDQLDSLTMTSTQLLAKQRDALDDTNKALFDSIQQEKARKDAQAEKASLEDRMNNVLLTSAQLRQKELDKVNMFNLSLAQTVIKLEDAKSSLSSFGVNGLSKMIQDALADPTGPNASAEAFAANLTNAVKNALISSVVGQVAEMIMNSIITPVVAGVMVNDTLTDSVVAKATQMVNDLAKLFSNDTFKDAMANIGTAIHNWVTEANALIPPSSSSPATPATPTSQAPTYNPANGPYVTGGPTIRFGPELGPGGANPNTWITPHSGLESVYGQHAYNGPLVTEGAGYAPGAMVTEWYVKLTDKAVSDRKTLQDQLDGLTLTNEQRLAKEREALDDVNKALWDQVQAATKAKAAAEERKSLQDEWDQLTMTSTELIKKQRDAVADGNKDLFDRIQAYKAEKAAAEAAAEATKKELEAKLALMQQSEQSQASLMAQQEKAWASQREWSQKLGVQSGFLNAGQVDRDNQRAQALASTQDQSTKDMINLFFDKLNLAAAAKVTDDYNRAMMEATGDSAGLKAFDRAVKDASLAAAGWSKEQINAVHAAEATSAATKVQNDFKRALLEASGDTAGLAAFDQELKDAALLAAGWTQAQINQINAMQAATAAAQAMKSTMDSIASTRVSLQQQLLTAQGKPEEALKLKRDTELAAALSGKTGNDAKLVEAAVRANWALEDQISALNAQAAAADKAAAAAQQAAQQQQQAADQLKSAWQGLTDSIYNEVQRIRGLMGTGTSGNDLATLQAQFAVETAKARAGDQDAAKLLPQISQAMLAMAAAQSSTLLELTRLQATTASSLEQTGQTLVNQYGLKIPGFASGGSFSGGMRIVGENGPELELTGPSRIFNAAETRSMLKSGGASDSELIIEMRMLRRAVEQNVINSNRTNKFLDKVIVPATTSGEIALTTRVVT